MLEVRDNRMVFEVPDEPRDRGDILEEMSRK